MAELAIADLIADALDLSGTEINDVLDAAPFVARLPFVESSNGETHKYIRHTTAPTVNFRAANAGRTLSKSADTLETATLKMLDWTFRVDKGVADIWRQGGAEALIAREARRHLRAALAKLETQILNGSDSDGFVGFLTSTKLDALADGMVVNATGSAAGTGSSVYLVRMGADVGVAGVYKGDGVPLSIGESFEDLAKDDGADTWYPAYVTPACGWFGLQVGGAYSISRICNLTAESGKGLTDDLISEAISRHPVDQMPNVMIMNRRSLKQLQQSRTATNATGAPAPFPTEAFGIPIIVTDQISSAETIET